MFTRNGLGALLAIGLAATSGCASILGDSSYPVEVSSAPVGASFEVTDKAGKVVHAGNTPSTVNLKSGQGYFKGQTYKLRFKKDGYPDKIVTLDSSLSGWYWGNIIFGGLIGLLIVDPATGAMYKLPDGVSADMGTPIALSNQSEMKIVMIDSLPSESRTQLVRID